MGKRVTEKKKFTITKCLAVFFEIEGSIALHPARLAALEKKISETPSIYRHSVRTDANRLIELVTNEARSKPEWELLLQYQTDLVQIYQKISSTKLDSALD